MNRTKSTHGEINQLILVNEVLSPDATVAIGSSFSAPAKNFVAAGNTWPSRGSSSEGGTGTCGTTVA